MLSVDRSGKRGSPYGIEELAVTLHRSRLGACWRWRSELLIALVLAAAFGWLWAVLGRWAWSLAILGGIALVLVIVPWSRRFLAARFWVLFTRHRLQRAFWELRLHTRAGRLPLIAWITATPVGSRALVICRAGLCFEDFEANVAEFASACGAREARITCSARWSWLIWIDVIRRRRDELGMSQAELAKLANVDARQIRRYEAGDQQPLFAVAVAIAGALRLPLSELAGMPAHRVKLSGEWWASWQTFRDGVEKIATQQVELRQEGELIYVATITRGLAVDEGGYHWSGELRLWDNEVLMGWYAANDGSIRSKGTLYFVLDAHGLHMSGRWVGLGYDNKIMTGWGSMGKTHDEAEAVIARLNRDHGGVEISSE